MRISELCGKECSFIDFNGNASLLISCNANERERKIHFLKKDTINTLQVNA